MDAFVFNLQRFANYYGTSGNDKITVDADYSYVYASSGNDSVYNDCCDDVTIDAGSGNDSIYNYIGFYNSIDGGSGNDTINSYAGYYATISGGSGNDRISLGGSYEHSVTVEGGSGNDTIYSGSAPIMLYKYSSGNDLIYNWNSANTLNLGGNYYTRSTVGSNVIIGIVGGGAVTLNSASGKTINITNGIQTITTPSGIINNTANNTTVNGTNYADTINNSGDTVKVYANAGNDSIYNSGYNTTIDAGTGADTVNTQYVNYVSITGGADNDSIYAYSTWYSTIDGGDGNDKILLPYRERQNSVNGGAGADTISLVGSQNGNEGTSYTTTVRGGAGNDLIYGDTINNGILYQFYSGDGYDTLYNWSTRDTLNLGGAYYTRSTVGTNVVISLTNGYSGAVTLNGASGKTVNIVNGTIWSGGGGDDGGDTVSSGKYIYNSNKNSLLSGTSYKDTITNYGGGVTIRAGAGNDTIYNSTLYTVKSSYGYVTIDAGDGNDTIESHDPYVSISGGAGNDSINLEGWSNITVNGGTGNDTILTTASNVLYQFKSGDGSDVITNWNTGDKISFGGGYYSLSTVGSDVVVNLTNGYSGSITLKGASGKTVNIVGGTLWSGEKGINITNNDENSLISGTSYKDTITNYGGGVTIRAGAGDDSIYNSTLYTVKGSYGYVTIDAGDGNDTIESNDPYVSIAGGAGNDSISLGNWQDITVNGGTGNDTIITYASRSNGILYQFKSGDGSDAITNWNAKDIVSLGGGYYSLSTVGSDVVVNLTDGYSGSITLKGASGKTVNIVGGTLRGGKEEKGKNIANYTSKVTLTGSDYDDTINNSGDTVKVNAGKGNDTIYNSGYNTTIDGGAGADTVNTQYVNYVSITGGADNDSIYAYSAWYSTINGGDGADKILLPYRARQNSVNGGAGADTISLVGSQNGNDGTYTTTVRGGTGDDVIYSDSVGNGILYQYSVGDGNDKIYNWNSRDSITVSGGTPTKATVGNDVVITAGSGKVTLVGAKGKTINLYPSTGPSPKPTVTPQEVIKKFMKSLDTTTDAGVAALNKAVSVATGGYFTNVQAAINQMVDDCSRTGNATKFLKDYCDIDLSNTDTGAITGYDAGGSSTQKDASDIVPESGTVNNFTDSSFITNGLTIKLAGFNGWTPYEMSYSSLSNDKQRYIWQALQTWWASSSLNLIAQSYGSNFGFSSSSSATSKELFFGFFNENSGTLAVTPCTYYEATGKTVQLGMKVNMNFYNNITVGDVDGKSSSTNLYLDRTLAHEFTHAVMAANIDFFADLPQFISEGMAELTHGIDDERKSTINSLAGNATSLKNSLALIPGTGTNDAYAGGYMFLRYLAKQGSQHYPSTGSSSDQAYSVQQSTSNTVPSGSSVSVKGSVMTLSKSFSDDMIDLSSYPSVKTVNATALGNGIMIIGNKNADSMALGIGNDTINANVGNDTILGGAGNDIIYGDAGNDKLYGEDGNDFICGGTGNDSLWGGAGKDVFIYKDGADFIADYVEGEDKIKIGQEYANVTSSSVSGNNVVLIVGTGSVTVKDGKGKKITVVDYSGKETTKVYGSSTGSTVTTPSGATTLTVTNSTKSPVTVGASVKTIDASKRTTAVKITGNALDNTILGGSKNDSLYGGTGNDSVLGNAGNDKLYGDAGDDTLNGGAGNDSLTGGAGNDLFIYSAGKDVIADYATGDKISLGAAVSKATVSGSDVVFTIGSGSLTVKNGKGQTLSMIDKSGSAYSTVVGSAATSTTLTVTNSTKSPVTVGASVKTIDASKRTTAVKITGNALDNTILGGSKNDSLYGGAGNDSIVGNAGNDKLYGGDGNDTLAGGKGNDSLWGNAGADSFLYSNGDGKDVIFGFEDNDLLQITGTFSATYNKSAKTIAFKVGSTASAITLKDFSATSFNINGDSYGISGTKLVKK